MAFQEYIDLQLKCIRWLGKHQHISSNEAALLWVKSGLAEKFALKHGPILSDTTK